MPTVRMIAPTNAPFSQIDARSGILWNAKGYIPFA